MINILTNCHELLNINGLYVKSLSPSLKVLDWMSDEILGAYSALVSPVP